LACLAFLSILVGILMKYFSKWVHEDEYRSDIVGSMILHKYRNIKDRRVSPTAYFNETTSIKKDHKVESIISQKLDFFFHPSKEERIKRLNEFEDFIKDNNNFLLCGMHPNQNE